MRREHEEMEIIEEFRLQPQAGALRFEEFRLAHIRPQEARQEARYAESERDICEQAAREQDAREKMCDAVAGVGAATREVGEAHRRNAEDVPNE